MGLLGSGDLALLNQLREELRIAYDEKCVAFYNVRNATTIPHVVALVDIFITLDDALMHKEGALRQHIMSKYGRVVRQILIERAR